jgi:hypothetical protein
VTPKTTQILQLDFRNISKCMISQKLQLHSLKMYFNVTEILLYQNVYLKKCSYIP